MLALFHTVTPLPLRAPTNGTPPQGARNILRQSSMCVVRHAPSQERNANVLFRRVGPSRQPPKHASRTYKASHRHHHGTQRNTDVRHFFFPVVFFFCTLQRKKMVTTTTRAIATLGSKYVPLSDSKAPLVRLLTSTDRTRRLELVQQSCDVLDQSDLISGAGVAYTSS